MPRILAFAIPALAILVLRAQPPAPPVPLNMSTPAGSVRVEQPFPGSRPPLPVLVSFDGLGAGFVRPQPSHDGRNPSDNSLAVGPDHIVQIVNSRFAVFNKTGKVLYGAVPTNTLFAGFGGPLRGSRQRRCRGALRPAGEPLALRHAHVPATPERFRGAVLDVLRSEPGCRSHRAFFRYEFKRPLFPDYPRPAVWPDGYYIPTSTSDNFIQKHVCVVERAKMLRGRPPLNSAS